MSDAIDQGNAVQIDNIRHPHDYKLAYVRLYPWNNADYIDLTNTRVTINIFEDIFQNFLTGNISISDTWDLTMLFPLIGEETLELAFYRPGTKNAGTGIKPPIPVPENIQSIDESRLYKKQFRVVKMSERQNVQEKRQLYILHFVSPELIVQKKKKVRKSYQDKLYSEIAEEIYTEFFKIKKPLLVEKTKYEQKLVVSSWTPAQAINIIASRSIAKGRKGSNYVFFENFHGFNYKSLEGMFESDSKEELIYNMHNIYIDGANKAIRDDVSNVEEYNFDRSFDIMSNLVNGMYASHLTTFDILRQDYYEYDFDYTKEFESTKHLGKEKLCTDNLDALGSPMSRQSLMGTNKDHDIISWIVGREPGIKPLKIEEYVLQRQSQFQQLNNVRMVITLPGDTSRTAGNVIKFKLPNTASNTKDLADEYDKYLSGKYLISAVRHRIEMEGYYQDIELIKDSYKNKIEYIDPVPLYLKTS